MYSKIWPIVIALSLLLFILGCCTSSDVVTARVVQVIDGDTIVIDGGERVRYIGIDTPERGEPYYEEARQSNRALVEGKVVRLEKDETNKDRYGRLLRYIYVDDIFVNARLVEEGYAEAKAYPPDLKHQGQLEQLEREAREAGRGMWEG